MADSVTAEQRALPDPESLRADLRARRQRIVDAAVRLMDEVDYERIQVKDVAEEAGVALGTLYRYFSSKDHLFAASLLSWSEGFDVHAGAGKGRSVDRVKAIYRRAVRAFERHPRVYRVVVEMQTTRDPNAAEVWRTFAERQTAAFESAMSQVPSSQRDDVAAVMNAVLDQGLRSWRFGTRPIADVYRAVDRAAELILAR